MPFYPKYFTFKKSVSIFANQKEIDLKHKLRIGEKNDFHDKKTLQ